MMEKDEEIKKLRLEGRSLRQIGSLLELSYETVRKRLKHLETEDLLSTVNPVNRQLSTKGVDKRFSSLLLERNVKERFRADRLISEQDLGRKWNLGRRIFLNLRENGCPWLDVQGKVFYH